MQRNRTAPVQSQAQEIKQQAEIGSQHRTEEVNRQNRENCSPATRRRETAHRDRKNTQVQHTVPVVSLQAYAQTLKQAWANGSLSKDEENLLLTLRKSMGISDEEHVIWNKKFGLKSICRRLLTVGKMDLLHLKI